MVAVVDDSLRDSELLAARAVGVAVAVAGSGLPLSSTVTVATTVLVDVSVELGLKRCVRVVDSVSEPTT